MAAKVLNMVVVGIGVLVAAVLAFIVVYVIGYSVLAIFGHGGMGSTGARGVGAGIAVIAALIGLGLYLRSRRSVAGAAGHHGRGRHAA